MIAAEDPSSAALLFVVLLHLVSIPETDRQFSARKGPAIQFTPAQQVRQTQAPHLIADKEDQVKKLKDKSVPEDEVKQVEKELQDITDKNIAECDKIYAAKEKEIMSI